jgi:hypothetical protein
LNGHSTRAKFCVVTDIDVSTVVAVGAIDVELRTLGYRRFEVATGARRFVLAADESEWESLRRAVTEIVPKLSRSLPIREQLAGDETELLRPHVTQLTSMGVLLHPREAIDSTADLRLYSLIARRSPSPDDVYASVKGKTIQIVGPADATAVISEVVCAQGLSVETDPAQPALTIVVSMGSESAVVDANERLCQQGASSLPVLIMSRRARVGPWTIPGESACLGCMPAGDDDMSGAVAGSWLTTQPGFLYWVGGLIAHLALRALIPIGAEHPWGQITTIDAVTAEQTTVRAWRDPYCPVCAQRRPTAQEWAEM